MAKILNIESSTTMCSVSLGVDGECADFSELNDGFSHAELLAVYVDEILKRNQLTVGQLDAAAVSMGPGSYTGLRIGVSLAKGLCFAQNLPLISVPTLQNMCLHPKVKKQVNFYKDLLLCPMLDARRMEVYTAMYDVGLSCIKDVEALVLEPESFDTYLNQEGVLFFGSGSDKFREIITHESAYFAEGVWPSAQFMAGLSNMKFENNEFEDVAYFEPFYLKEFMATTPKKLL